jgi:hypothetical protein
LLVAGIRPYSSVKAGDGLGVVVENIRPGVEYNVERLFTAAKIRYKNLDSTPGIQSSNPADRFSEMGCAAIGKLVAIHTCDNGVPYAQSRNSLANVPGLIRVNGARLPLADRTEATVSCADVAQNHEGGGALAPALEYVRAASLLTHRVKTEIVDHPLNAAEGLVRPYSHFQPGGPRTGQFWLGHEQLP